MSKRGGQRGFSREQKEDLRKRHFSESCARYRLIYPRQLSGLVGQRPGQLATVVFIVQASVSFSRLAPEDAELARDCLAPSYREDELRSAPTLLELDAALHILADNLHADAITQGRAGTHLVESASHAAENLMQEWAWVGDCDPFRPTGLTPGEYEGLREHGATATSVEVIAETLNWFQRAIWSALSVETEGQMLLTKAGRDGLRFHPCSPYSVDAELVELLVAQGFTANQGGCMMALAEIPVG